jgi:hypothetical protein
MLMKNKLKLSKNKQLKYKEFIEDITQEKYYVIIWIYLN